MKTHTLRFREENRDIFDEVRDGLKTVETRAATSKYASVEAGDTLTLVCGKDRLSKTVAKKEHFKSIDALVKKIPFKKIMPSVSSVEEMKEVYFSFPGYEEKIKESGIFAFILE